MKIQMKFSLSQQRLVLKKSGQEQIWNKIQNSITCSQICFLQEMNNLVFSQILKKDTNICKRLQDSISQKHCTT